MDSAHAPLGSTREEPGLGGAKEGGESWRQKRGPQAGTLGVKAGVSKGLECWVGESR